MTGSILQTAQPLKVVGSNSVTATKLQASGQPGRVGTEDFENGPMAHFLYVGFPFRGKLATTKFQLLGV